MNLLAMLLITQLVNFHDFECFGYRTSIEATIYPPCQICWNSSKFDCGVKTLNHIPAIFTGKASMDSVVLWHVSHPGGGLIGSKWSKEYPQSRFARKVEGSLPRSPLSPKRDCNISCTVISCICWALVDRTGCSIWICYFNNVRGIVWNRT